MFKIGERYTFEMLDCTDDQGQRDISSYPSRVVTAVDGPLVQIESVDGAIVINTHSSTFVRATHRPAKESSGKFAPGKPPSKP